MIDGETKVHALYGQPVSHSLSPLVFNRTFDKLGFNRTYLAFEVSSQRLSDAVEAAKSLGFEGFNVTMPHKTTILPLLDKVDGTAEEIGAVNTVARSPRGLQGYNTDGEGGLRALKAHGFDPRDRKVVVIGAGGAARAIIHSLSAEADEVRVLDRSVERARAITDRTSGKAKILHGPLSRKELEQRLQGATLLVNATPIQTSRLIEKLGSSQRTFPSDLWIFDLAYDELPNKINGPRRIHPLEMLAQQAALSYEIWLGQPGPVELIRSILVEHNGGDWR